MWETEAQKVNATTHQYFDHPFSVELSCSSLARDLKIIAVKVRETSTNTRNCFSQLCSASLKSRPWPPSPQSGTAAQEVILSRRSFQCSTFTLAGWMSFSVRQYILASSLSIFFSGQIHHFLKYFYIIATEQLWWHTTNVGLCFYILLQSAMKLHGGLLRHMHFKSLHITLESANWPSNEWVKFRSRDLSVYWYFNEWGNSTIILITLALSHAWELSCRPRWPHISLKCK